LIKLMVEDSAELRMVPGVWDLVLRPMSCIVRVHLKFAHDPFFFFTSGNYVIFAFPNLQSYHTTEVELRN
jgi:hypothetical protein